MNNELSEKKSLNGFLIIDYKTGHFRATKKKPYKTKLSEIPINVTIDFTIPKQPKFEAKAQIELTPIQMSKMMLEKIQNE